MKDLTKGYPAKVIMLFAIPLMCGYIFQNLYNMVDSKIVSTFVSKDAFAAVGATAVVSNTIIGFMSGLTQGFGIPIATSFGAGDYKRVKKYVAGTMVLTFSISILLTVVSMLSIESLLLMLDTPKEIMPDALDYVNIILAGIIFSALYNMCANILRAVGDSKTPLYCLILAVAANVFLDLLFVKGFGWGIKGAAYATIISQAMSGVFCGIYLVIKFRDIIPGKNEWKLDRGQYSNLITTGISMGLMSCIVNIGTIVLQGSINGLGTDIIAAHTAARRVFDILIVALYSVGMAMTTFTSQNMGAGMPERVRQGVRHSIFITSVATIILMASCLMFGEPVLEWITNSTDSNVIDPAVMYLKISIMFFFVLGPLFTLRCTLQGMGRKIIPVCSSVLEMLVKILSAAFLVPAFEYVGVAFTEPISWIVMTILLGAAYLAKKPDAYFKEG